MSSVTTSSSTSLQKDLSRVITEGLVTQAMAVLTSGSFLIAFALKLGATSLQIGIMTAIPLLSNVLQLASVYFVQKFNSRKRVVVACTAIGRGAYLLIALLPFVQAEGLAVPVIFAALCIQHGMGAISNGAWSSWMRDVIPHQQMGSFFSRRLGLSQVVSVVLSVACAVLMHHYVAQHQELELYSYGLLFLLGTLCGLIASYLLSQTSEPTTPTPTLNMLRLFHKPFRHHNFRNLMAYMASWNFAINLSVPFAAVYMMKTLELGLSTVIALNVLTQLTNIVCFRWWGRVVDQCGNKTLLKLCVPLYLVSNLLWIFTTMPDKHAFTFPLLILIHLFNGIATAGTGLASSSIGMKLAPKKDSVAYLSLLSFTNALASGIAPLLSGWAVVWFADVSVAWTLPAAWHNGTAPLYLLHLQHWDFFFALSFVLGLFALHRLSKVKDPSQIDHVPAMINLAAVSHSVAGKIVTLRRASEHWQSARKLRKKAA